MRPFIPLIKLNNPLINNPGIGIRIHHPLNESAEIPRENNSGTNNYPSDLLFLRNLLFGSFQPSMNENGYYNQRNESGLFGYGCFGSKD